MIFHLLKLVSFLIACLPLPVLLFCAKTLSRAAYTLDRKHRKIAIDNLTMAFGDEKSSREIHSIAKKVFENFFATFFEFMRLIWFPARAYKYVEYTGTEHLDRAFERGRGVVMCTPHFGNWEYMAARLTVYVMENHGREHEMDVVVRGLDIEGVDRFVRWGRERSGYRVVDKRKSMRRLIKTLSNNGILGILLDQNVTLSEGVFVDFFGKAACTNKGPAILAQKMGAALIPIFSVRHGKRHRIVVEPEIETVDTGDREADARENTARITRRFEEMIRAHPEQWFWVHRRWKTRPLTEG